MTHRELFLDYDRGDWHEWKYFDKLEYTFRVPFKNAQMHCVLGRVKKKNDGRWEWFRIVPGHLWDNIVRQEPLQGVCMTLSDAKEQAVCDVKAWYIERVITRELSKGILS